MQLTTSKLDQIKADFPWLTFTKSASFKWLPKEKTIHYIPDEDYGLEHLLHELAHAELQHHEYPDDLTLLSMERDAWQHAVTRLAVLYGVTISSELVQNDLDSYRDWLHARSTCPNCSANGIQVDNEVYNCVVCHQQWRVNKAVDTQLQRHRI